MKFFNKNSTLSLSEGEVTLMKNGGRMLCEIMQQYLRKDGIKYYSTKKKN